MACLKASKSSTMRDKKIKLRRPLDSLRIHQYVYHLVNNNEQNVAKDFLALAAL